MNIINCFLESLKIQHLNDVKKEFTFCSFFEPYTMFDGLKSKLYLVLSHKVKRRQDVSIITFLIRNYPDVVLSTIFE